MPEADHENSFFYIAKQLNFQPSPLYYGHFTWHQIDQKWKSIDSSAVKESGYFKSVQNLLLSATEYIKDHIFELQRKIWWHDWSSQLYAN